MPARLPLELELVILELVILELANDSHYSLGRIYPERVALLRRLALVHRDWTPWAQGRLFEQVFVFVCSPMFRGKEYSRGMKRLFRQIQLATKYGRPLQRMVLDGNRDDGVSNHHLAIVRQRCPDLREAVLVEFLVYPFFATTFPALKRIKIQGCHNFRTSLDFSALPLTLEHLTLVHVVASAFTVPLPLLHTLIIVSTYFAPPANFLSNHPRLRSLALLKPAAYPFGAAVLSRTTQLENLLLHQSSPETLRGIVPVILPILSQPSFRCFTWAAREDPTTEQEEAMLPVEVACRNAQKRLVRLPYWVYHEEHFDEKWGAA
ncbi:hypothetical protein JCM11641_007786 [Rhodosporidiobolus odoratus]